MEVSATHDPPHTEFQIPSYKQGSNNKIVLERKRGSVRGRQ